MSIRDISYKDACGLLCDINNIRDKYDRFWRLLNSDSSLSEVRSSLKQIREAISMIVQTLDRIEVSLSRL